MNSLNILNDVKISELIVREQILFSNKIIEKYNFTKAQNYICNVIKDNLYKYLNIDFYKNNFTINDLKKSNLFDKSLFSIDFLNNKLNKNFIINEHLLCDINNIKSEKIIERFYYGNYTLYTIKKIIILFFINDYEGEVIINKYNYPNIKAGTLFMFPNSFIFNIHFSIPSETKVILTYISELTYRQN